MNIKNPRAIELVREYSELTGQTQTEGVITAVQLAIAAEHQSRERGTRELQVARRRASSYRILEEIRRGFGTAPMGERDRINEQLYDPAGLPR